MDTIVSSVIGTRTEYTVAPVMRVFGHLIHYETNIPGLEKQIEKLKAQRDGVELRIQAATSNLKTVLPEVTLWLTDVDQTIQNKETRFEKERTAKAACCSAGRWFPNLKIRHSLSRKAKKMTPDIDSLLDKTFEVVACEAPPPELGFQPTQQYEDSNALVTNFHEGDSSSKTSKVIDFESRKPIIENVMEALKGNQVNLIVICGMGGVGKTTMVDGVVTRAKKEGLFDKYAEAVVNEKPEISKIQSDIAEFLGQKLDEQGLEARAAKLLKSLSSTTSVLVVLDNVWETLDRHKIGIPSDMRSCKILITSRNRDIFNEMEESKESINMELLSESDAWILFKKMAGGYIDSDPVLRPIAEEVLQECGRLPVAILTLGSAPYGRKG